MELPHPLEDYEVPINPTPEKWQPWGIYLADSIHPNSRGHRYSAVSASSTD